MSVSTASAVRCCGAGQTAHAARRGVASSSRVSASIARPLHRRHAARQRLAAPPASVPDLDALLGGLDAPDIGADLTDVQAEQGAVFDDAGVVVHFKNDSRAMYALEHAAVVVDRSHWGRLRLAGDDRLSFLHGQSTNDIQALQPGAGCDTVFVTAQARTIDLATVLAQGSGAMVLVSPDTKQTLLERLDKHIFPGDKVQVMDISAKTCMFSLLGPQADAVMQKLQAGAIVGAAHASHSLLSFASKPVIVVVGGGLELGSGYTFIADESIGVDVWRALTSQEGVEPLGSDAWEMARVLAGRPKPGAELTADFNPLEAGLYHAISVNKGCYIGQETIAKVHNLNAVKQQLWALEMETPCVVGDSVTAAVDGSTLGRVTSYIDTPSGQHRALAYLKCKSGGKQVTLEGAAVVVNGVRGVVVAPPFLSRGFPEAAGSAASGGDTAAQQQEAADVQQKAAEEEKRRAEKLRQMQERLAAFQAQQQQQQ